MAARAPSGRQSTLPKSWDEMTNKAEPDPKPASKSKPASTTTTPAASAQPAVAASVTAVAAKPASKLPSSTTSASRNIPPQRRPFWHEHKNATLTIVVLFCPILSMVVLLVLARNLHPLDGAYHDGRTVNEWVSLLGDNDPLLRSQAFETLVKLGDKVTPQLARALRDPEVQRRRDAALAMQKIRPSGKLATDALAGALQDYDIWVRWRSAQALRAMGPNARDAVNPLATALTDDDPRVRCAAAQALGRIGKEAYIAQPALMSAMKDERAYVRRAASDAMQDIMTEINQ